MKLSIVTINYNNAEGLERTLNSVLAQTYDGIEHIIVDGGSTDGSVDVIKRYVERVNSEERRVNSVIWSSEKDNGVYHAMNKGIRKASGDYIQILNSGDLLAAPDVTERMIKELESERLREIWGVDILYGNMMKDYGNGKLVRDNCGGANSTESFMYFYRGTLNHDCAYIRRDLFDKYGLYNEDMKICSDWEWYVRVIVLGGTRMMYTDIDVTIFDMNGISESGGKNKELIKKERREYLIKILPPVVLRDYDKYALDIEQVNRLRKYHLWGLVYFMERVLFKLEKWHLLK